MIHDAWLIVGKEYREVLLRMGSLRANILNLALILGVFGIVMPLQAGKYWVERWWMLTTWVWLPMFMVSALVADSFAGERERHTLETLLASRLSDSAILLGKMGAALLYGYGTLLAVTLVSLITVNVRYGSLTHPLLFPFGIFVCIFVFGFLITLLIASIGVMVSLKAQTVRQAGQALSLGLLGIITVPLIVFAWIFSRLPQQMQVEIITGAAFMKSEWVALFAAIVLALVDAVFVAIAVRRFKRSRLLLD